jgi:hypothetical protein
MYLESALLYVTGISWEIHSNFSLIIFSFAQLKGLLGNLCEMGSYCLVLKSSFGTNFV